MKTHKEARNISEQIALLRKRGMQIKDEKLASFYLGHISYYRLKGYWWDMQKDNEKHIYSRKMQILMMLSNVINLTANYD
ncbi:hypothetical protein FACS1894178_0800 [Bacteroidia bacterium]|nr:hypothetical protein FACS1894178_0800 [Bacteroidia bacterium]